MTPVTATLDSIWQTIAGNQKSPFILTSDRTFSYGDLCQEIRRLCGQFDANNAGGGARILIVSGDEFGAAASFIAALLDGHVPVMLSHDTAADRANAIFDSIEPAMVMTDESRTGERWASAASIIPDAAVRAGGGKTSGLFSRLRSRGREDVGKENDGRDPKLPDDRDALAYVLFTSGTTSKPNGVQITRNNLLRHLDTLVRLFAYSPQSRIFNATPIAHTDGLVQGPLLAVASGGALIRPGAFSVPGIEDWLHSLRQFRATHFITNPTVLALVDRYAAHSDYFDAPEFQAILSSAAVLRPDLWTRFQDRFNRPLFNIYGMTETVANATYAGDHPEFGLIGTIGLPIDCEARLASPDGVPLGAGDDQTGELQLRGENIFHGYWKNPTRTAETFTEDGWMRTGDLAKKRDDGSFEILGRLKTAINSGGTLVRPEEIDEVLLNHPAVQDSVTVGFPDPDFDEIPVSAIVLDSNLPPVDEATLTAHCRDRLEALKVPKKMVILDRIPRGDSGKPKLDELRTMINQELEPDVGDTADQAAGTLQDQVIAAAAKVFRVDPGALELDSSPETVKGWDSFTQINLVISIEGAFNVRFPAATVSRIRKIGDLVDAVKSQQASDR